MWGVGLVRQPPRPRHFWCTASGKSIGADPILPHPSRRVGENGRVSKAGDPGSTVFVDQDICLAYGRRELGDVCSGTEEWPTVWMFPWTIPRS